MDCACIVSNIIGDRPKVMPKAEPLEMPRHDIVIGSAQNGDNLGLGSCNSGDLVDMTARDRPEVGKNLRGKNKSRRRKLRHLLGDGMFHLRAMGKHRVKLGNGAAAPFGDHLEPERIVPLRVIERSRPPPPRKSGGKIGHPLKFDRRIKHPLGQKTRRIDGKRLLQSGRARLVVAYENRALH